MSFWKGSKRRKQDYEYNNRINIIIAIIFLLALSIVYRLYFLQVANYDYYIAMASDQHQIFSKLNPNRGKIFIKNGTEEGSEVYPIASNKELALVYAVPKDIKDPYQTADKLYKIFFKEDVEKEIDEFFEEKNRIDISEALSDLAFLNENELLDKKNEIIERQKLLMQDEEYREFVEVKREAEINLKKEKIINDLRERLSRDNDPYEPIKDLIDEEKLAELELENIEGVSYIMKMSRYYTEDMASHISGFVGFSGDKRKGLYGLEGFFDEELSGMSGIIRAERDATGKPIIVNNMDYSKAINGSDLYLTIDKTIQYTACKMLEESVLRHGADGGTVIIMKPSTGEIISMCSFPDYNPNLYSEVEDSNVYNNPAIFDQYEPGSVFKAITMAASMEEGAITPKTIFNDKGSVMIEGWPKPIKNSDFETHGGHGWVDMTTVLSKSLNTGTIFAMEKMGYDKFSKYVRNFGFGEKTGIELETEAPGNIYNLNRKKSRPVEIAVASFGQGISVTPLQMVNSFSAIANGGKLMKPYLVKEIVAPDGTRNITNPKEIRRVISEKTATLLTGMLVQVVEGGHAKHASVDGYYVAGKTGTAQVADRKKKGYGDKTIHTFVGFSPVENPQFVMLVKLDDPKDVMYSASSAAPLFGDIAEFILNHWQVTKEKIR